MPRPPRLLHLNGPPGIGKSTLARRYADERPGVLDADIDLLRMLVGGWQDDFVTTGEIVRPGALALIVAHLESGRDVVMPQMIARSSEVERFRSAATAAGATYTQVMLIDDRAAAIARFHRRTGEGPLLEHVRDVVARDGGDRFLGMLHDGLTTLSRRDGVVLVDSVEGDLDGTYRRLLAAVDG
ncbi:ATP-binding protein [Nocardioides sp. HDW12B]|uniref:AAA family ATPase n=1 Tax=Nocardioides sp. HDW12B TaxID=2714939 RepID=UPI00140D139C|nr:AAA family ATPase [Nocardioides sp. HDW12B]QIK66945.1 ATP-binding protein [Nocardioides sp. HDW12B]